MGYKAVVTDYTFADLQLEQRILEAADCELAGRQCKTENELIQLCAEADAVITQFARISANVIRAMKRARVIVRYGIGVDNVALDAARASNIPVCNVPDYCLNEVADHTLALILGTTRQIVPHTLRLRAGQWGMATPLPALKALRDLTVGVIGFGRIGREVVQRLIPFKCAVLVCDPIVAPAEIERAGARAASFETIIQTADVLTLHCPSTPETRKIVNRNTVDKLKPGAILINAGRGDLVDESALVEALKTGHLAAAALDVFEREPVAAGNPLLKMPNVILSPHIAAISPASVQTLREAAANLAVKALRNEPLPNIVNGVGNPR
jgi:D-3-phosphoglycerate dehydrogenase